MARPPRRRTPDQLLAHILCNIEIDEETGCWHWTRSLNTNGYGHVRRDGRLAYVHRIVYERLVGPIPPGYLIDHQCHNADLACVVGSECQHRRCANPDHLRAVVQRWNVAAGRLGDVVPLDRP